MTDDSLTKAFARARKMLGPCRDALKAKYPDDKARAWRAIHQTESETLFGAFFALEERVKALEVQQKEFAKDLTDRGVWEKGELYRTGNFVSHSGSLWICKQGTQSRPGTDASSWRLCVKNGAHR